MTKHVSARTFIKPSDDLATVALLGDCHDGRDGNQYAVMLSCRQRPLQGNAAGATELRLSDAGGWQASLVLHRSRSEELMAARVGRVQQGAKDSRPPSNTSPRG